METLEDQEEDIELVDDIRFYFPLVKPSSRPEAIQYNFLTDTFEYSLSQSFEPSGLAGSIIDKLSYLPTASLVQENDPYKVSSVEFEKYESISFDICLLYTSPSPRDS